MQRRTTAIVICALASIAIVSLLGVRYRWMNNDRGDLHVGTHFSPTWTAPFQVELLDGWPLEEGGSFRLQARRILGRNNTCSLMTVEITLHLSFTGSAKLGTDFVVPTTLVIPAGKNSSETIGSIVDDLDAEMYETVVPLVEGVSGIIPVGCVPVALPSLGAALIIDNDKPPCQLSHPIVGEWRKADPAWAIPRYECAHMLRPQTFQSGVCVLKEHVELRGETPDHETTAVFEPSECSLLWTNLTTAKAVWRNRTIVVAGDSVTRHHAAELNCLLLNMFPGDPEEWESWYSLPTILLPCSAEAAPQDNCAGSSLMCFQHERGNFSRLCFLEEGLRVQIKASELVRLITKRDELLVKVIGPRDVWLVNFGLHLPTLADVAPFAAEMRNLLRRPAAKRPHVWFRETSAQHFPAPDGSGNFWHAPAHVRNSCVPIANYSLGRNLLMGTLDAPFAAEGVPVVPTWDATASRHVDHLSYRWVGAEAPFVDGFDCTHFCQGSAVYAHWNRLLFHFIRTAVDS